MAPAPLRGRPARRLAALAAAALLAALHATAASDARGAGSVSAVGNVGITVSDLDRSVAFYTGVLSFEKVSETEVLGQPWEQLTGVFGARLRVARLRLGAEELELTEWVAPRGRPVPQDSRSQDRWFQHVAIIVSDMDRAYARLRASHVEHASTAPQRLPDWNPKAGGIQAFYFKDPDGHVLEILAFPPGKGDARWHVAPATGGSGRLFLGIDHTAIVVSDTDASLRFWRDALGLRVAGESENWGTEQAHLNQVEGAHLRITTLRATAGPGVELLEYLAPRDGRPRPADARANDLLHWQTTVLTDHPDGLADRLRAANAPFVSRTLVQLPPPGLGFARAALVSDPDGHVVRLVD